VEASEPIFAVLLVVMSAQAFVAAELAWHDFFLAAASASAALLGLLFVGVSINLRSIAGGERVDLRARAGQAFVNLISVLVIAMLMLIPDPDPASIAVGLGVVAGLGLLRAGQNLYPVLRGRAGFANWLQIARRIGWTAVADLVLIFTASRMWSSADAAAIQNLVTVVFVLLIGAADAAWAMLVEVSGERTD
jgi:modulator of FtsH protease